MGHVIAKIITIVLALGLIGSSIVSIQSNAKEAGETTKLEQKRLGKMIANPDAVTGDTVKGYIANPGTATVTIFKSDGLTAITTANITNKSLFNAVTTFDVNGNPATIVCTQIDLDE